ncbi:MAG: prolipoprotein diacylglyceryl transferase [Candidatus Fimenecus sp.]|nr:prolipoprotein diacylglyceryl transferase [Clostridia bacterium]
MQFFTDYTAVRFTGIDHIFNVYSTFCEFSLFGKEFSIKFYGVIIAFGFLLAVLFGGRMAYKWKLDLNKMLDILLFGTIGGILGARLYYVLFEWEYYRVHLAEIPQIWHGGLAIYGGLIGGILAAYFTCRHNGLNFLKLLDLAGMSFLIGQGIGRWGNYANQEAFGTNTEGFLGMSSAKVTDYIYAHESEFLAKGITMDPSLPVHPTFLYESIWCIFSFFVLYLICKKAYKFSGQLILCYGVLYGAERAVVEGLRTDSLYIGSTSLRVSQVLSLVLAVTCLAILIIKFVQLKKNPVPYTPVEELPPELDYQLDTEKTEKREKRQKVKTAQQAKNKMLEKQQKEARKNGNNS